MVAVMLPAAEYHALVQTVRLKIAAFLFIASFFILISVLWTSKKYVALYAAAKNDVLIHLK